MKLLWVFIFLYIGLIYMTLPLARYFLNILYTSMGPSRLNLLVNLTIAISVILAFLLLARKGIRVFLFSLPPAVVIGSSAVLLERPAERIHFLEYGLLGFLLCRAFEGEQWLRTVYAGMMVIAVGAVDEIIQWFLPMRVGDLRDVLFNALGGLMGLWLGRVYYYS